MSFADWPWSVIAPTLGLKMTLDVLDKTIHTRTKHMLTSPAPHSSDYYVRHVGHTTRDSN